MESIAGFLPLFGVLLVLFFESAPTIPPGTAAIPILAASMAPLEGDTTALLFLLDPDAIDF